MAEDNTPTNVVDDVIELENNIRSKYSDYLEKDTIKGYEADPKNSFKRDMSKPMYEKRGIQLNYFEGNPNANFPYNKDTLFIKYLYIDETQRGQGVGSQIFDEIKQFADDNGLYIRLKNDENFNTSFWEKKGFGIYEGDKSADYSFARLDDYVLAPKGETLPVTPNRLDTPTNVVDDFKLSGTMGGNTTPTGNNIAYANVEDLEQFIQFDRKAEGNIEKINEIKKTISSKGYLYDSAYDGGVVFGVTVDELGNVQIAEGNHRLQALIDFARETGQEIYVPINPVLTSTGSGNKVQLTNTDNAYNSMKQLLTDMLEGNKNFDLEYTIKTKLGEPGRRIVGLDSYTYPGGSPGTSTTQSNIKKFFNSIGLNTITYDELPDNNVYKTGVNTFTDTPTNIAGAEVIDEIEGIQRETVEKLRNANDEFVAEQIDNIMARKINEVLPFVDTSLSRAEAIGISTTGPQITTSADPTLNTFIDEIEKITGQTIDIYDKRKLRQFIYDVAKGNDNLLDDKKSFKFNLQGGVDNSKLSDSGYKIWKNWQHTGAFNITNIRDMTVNELTAFGPPPWVYLVDGLEKSGESINFTAISDADVNIPDTPGGSLGAAKLNDPLVFDSWVDNYAKTTTSFVDNLPLVKPVKDLFLNAADNRLKRLAGQVATPGGLLDAVDIWEIGVLALVAGAIAYNEIDEIPKIGKNAILRTYNLSQGRPIDAPLRIIGLPEIKISEYDIDFEYAMETLERGEKVMPTDIIIKKLAESSLEKGEPAVLPGTGVTATTGIDEEFAPYKESIIKEREETARIKRDEVKQDLLESKGVQEEKMFEQAKPKKRKPTGGAGAKIL